MSLPQSKLSEFRSYSYYHVLALCNGSSAANALTDSTQLGVWQHPADDTMPLGKFSPKFVDGNETQQYVILVNGSTDATFSIVTAKWSATVVADATPQDSNTSVAVEGSLTIAEPKGVVFMDQVIKSCNAMDLNIQNAVYVLKTFFVGYGYNEEEGDYVEHITDIPPLVMNIFDIKGKFTEQGGQYDLQFTGLSGGTVRLPQYSRLPGAVTISAAPTLGGTLKKLEARIQSMYQPYFNCVRSQLSAAITAAGRDPIAALASLLPVTYKISCDGELDGYTVTNQSQQSKTDPGCGDPVNITSSANMSIEDIIHNILSMSREVQDSMVKGIGSPPIRYEYKIHAFLTSADTGPVVTYHISRFMNPSDIHRMTTQLAAQSYDKGTASDPLVNTQLRQDIIEFDYIYTGKNIDILDFEIQMNQGLSYLQIATSANTFKDQLDDVASINIVPMTSDLANMSATGRRTAIPVFFGSHVSTVIKRNTQDAIGTAQAAYTMIKHSSLEMGGGVKMKIVGNLNLLGGINKYTDPQFHFERINERRANFDSTGKSDPSEQLVYTGRTLAGFGVSPTYAHINIKMPRSNDDIALFSGTASDDGTADYAVDFWFNGFYHIVHIENVYDNGEFTQELDMIGIPNIDIMNETTDIKTSIKDGTPTEIALNNRISDCFSGTVGCGQQSPAGTGANSNSVPAPAVKDGKVAGTPAVSNKADATTVNSTVAAPSDVKGWDKAKPAVKSSIIDAAAATGTSATTLAQMAAIESRFGSATVNPTSTARGTFQIVRSTWNGTVASGVPGVPRGTPFDNANNLDQNALVAATLMTNNQRQLMSVLGVTSPAQVTAGDTYMAHFMGAAGARAVIIADRASNGSVTVREAYQQYFGKAKGDRIYSSQIAANKGILSESTTVGEIRAKTEISMANSVPLASVRVAGGSHPVQTTSASKANEPSTATRPAAVAVAACKECPTDSDDKKQSCNQAKPDTDKK